MTFLKKVSLYKVILLAFAVLAIYGQTVDFDFIDFDDLEYMREVKLQSSETMGAKLGWAFTHMETGDWQPVIWLSWMVDEALHGLSPGILHTQNVLLHFVVALLLYIFLSRVTKRNNLSFLVALLFTLHPLRVESVAWISQRKDLLSGVFFMLTLLSYSRYVEKVGARLPWYILTLVLFALGLMTKPMLVTLPLILLLIDYWPLQRWKNKEKQERTENKTRCRDSERFFFFRFSPSSSFFTLIIEKLPFFLLSGISSILTLNAVKTLYSEVPVEILDWMTKFKSIIWAYGEYFVSFVFPLRLSFYYPRPLEYGLLELIAYGGLLTVITFLSFLYIKTKPYLIVGWGWFLIMLLPVSGFIAQGSALRADRYTYFAHMGLIVLVAWWLSSVYEKSSSNFRKMITVLFALIFISYGIIAFKYCGVWKNSKQLNEHGMKISERNHRAINNLGVVYLESGDYQKALELFQRTKELFPGYRKSNRNIGVAYYHLGNFDQALVYLLKAKDEIRKDPEIYHRIGDIFRLKGDDLNAIKYYELSLKHNPHPSKDTYFFLGNLYRKNENLEKSLSFYLKSLEIDPTFAGTHNNLANLYVMLGDKEKAVDYYENTLRYDSEHANAKKILKVLDK